MPLIYHITRRTLWESSLKEEQYFSPQFSQDNFVHCSYVHQLITVANARFFQQSDLVILCIDRDQTEFEVIDENLEGGVELFPHIYGGIKTKTVRKIFEFPCEEDGTFRLPNELANGT